MYLTSNFYIKSVTYVKTTTVAETIVKFYDLLAFGSVKIIKIEFSIKGAQFSIKSAQNRSFLSGGFS